MRERLDFSDMPTSLEGQLTPSARVADALLRRTFSDPACDRLLRGAPCLVSIYGISPVDGPVFCEAVRDLVEGAGKRVVQIKASCRDWTDTSGQRPQYVERLLVEASLSIRPVVVLCHRKSEVPGVVATVADAVVPLARQHDAIADTVRETAGFRPDERLVSRLARLPLSYLNLAIRPGMTADRIWRIAGRLRSQHPGNEGERRTPKPTKDEGQKPAAMPGAGSSQVGPERLEDLAGMAEAQCWGLSLAADLAEYRAGSLPWPDVESGMLLHGPPGTGKTLFARALAGSCGVPLHSHSVAAWQAKGHLGDLLKAMRAAFDEARKATPCVLFLDELDSVGSRDEPLGEHASYQRQVVNGLLECLDGAAQRDGVVVVGATNNPGAIDAAVVRPGRLGRHIEVKLPDLAGRVGILKHHLRDELPEADLARLANEFGEASGAALAQLVREARSLARRERRPLSEADLWAALPPGVLLSDAAFRRMCVHEAGHVVAGLEMAAVSGLVPTKVSVWRRVREGGDNKTDFDVLEGTDQSRECVEGQIVVMLAGVAAEEVLLGSRSTLAGGSYDADLVRATGLATSFELSFGLGDRLHAVPTTDLAAAASSRDVERSRDRVERVLARCFGKAKEIVEKKRDEVQGLAARLAEVTTITLV